MGILVKIYRGVLTVEVVVVFALASTLPMLALCQSWASIVTASINLVACFVLRRSSLKSFGKEIGVVFNAEVLSSQWINVAKLGANLALQFPGVTATTHHSFLGHPFAGIEDYHIFKLSCVGGLRNACG